MKILSVNAGSSSLKFRLYEMPEETLLMKGMFERIGEVGSEYSIKIGDLKIQDKVVLKTHTDAVHILIDQILKNGLVKSLDEIGAVGHRIVHGGNKYSKSVLITKRVIDELEEISDLAPLHNPAHLMGIRAFKEAVPDTKMVVCFDTAFHQTMKEATYLYSVPYEWYTKYDVRKYGFHGLSHQFVTNRMQEILARPDVNLIICHIGNGASISLIEHGKCIDTSMGFTPNAGIMMGTRCGDIDYSMLVYIMKKTGLTMPQIDTILNKESGLQGIAGMSDLRDLDRSYEAKEKKAVLAFTMYINRIVEYIAKYHIKIDHLDAICFTAGGGENDTIIRREVLKKLAPLGIYLDADKNEETVVRNNKEGIITTDNSKIPCYVVATDEELMIARDTYKLVI
ncbi:MAG: acetate kinase [Bacilli bacterium]